MIENQPVLTIHRGHRRPDGALIEAFRGAMTSHLVDAMEGRGAVDWLIKPMDAENASFVGPALTAHRRRTIPVVPSLSRGHLRHGGGSHVSPTRRRHHVRQ